MSKMGAADEFKAVRPMTVQVVRTKAETALLEQLTAHESGLPGRARVHALRRDAIGRFSSLGLPHRRIEEWKYTDLRALIKEVYPLEYAQKPAADSAGRALAADPGLIPDLENASTIRFVDHARVEASNLPDGVTVERLSQLLEEEPEWLLDEIEAVTEAATDAMTAVNTAMMVDGAVIRIKAGTKLTRPLHIVHQPGRYGAAAVALRHVVLVEKGASAVIVESYASSAAAPRQRHMLTQVIAGDNTDVTHLKFVATAGGSLHLGKRIVSLGAGTIYRPFTMTIGDGLVRNDLLLTFRGEGSELDLGGAFLAGSNGHSDTTLVIDHAVPRCKSRELMKGVLDGEARGIFQGKVIVRPGAQKTDGKQMAQALLLSPDAEFDSKPELEIYADDVVCGHGSTSAELDEDLVFYCRSRGIPPEEAKALLVELFIGEAIDKIEHEAPREAFMALARHWLRDNRAKAAA